MGTDSFRPHLDESHEACGKANNDSLSGYSSYRGIMSDLPPISHNRFKSMEVEKVPASAYTISNIVCQGPKDEAPKLAPHVYSQGVNVNYNEESSKHDDNPSAIARGDF